MNEVSSVVELDLPAIDRLDEAAVQALEKTAEALHGEVVQAQVVPRATGTLQNEAMSVDTTESSDGRVAIVHSTPYARRLYFHPEYKFHKEPWEGGEGNPNAQGEWFKAWLPGGDREDFAPEAFAENMRRLTGG